MTLLKTAFPLSIQKKAVSLSDENLGLFIILKAKKSREDLVISYKIDLKWYSDNYGSSG